MTTAACGHRRRAYQFRVTDSVHEVDFAPGSPPDLERQATAASLRGEGDVAEDLWISAHNEWLGRQDPRRAARCIFWLVLELFNRREWARGNGWLARGRHILEPVGDCAALGLLLAVASRDDLRQGDTAAASTSARRAVALAGQYPDAELHVISRLALALVQARQGEAREAASLFDEIMVGVTVDDVSPIAVGVAYCAVIDACRSLFDLSRAREWTTALDRWCANHEHMVAFRGKCLVHRTEVLRLSGDWSQAFTEAEQACAWSGGHENSFLYPSGAAFYELGELHRLRGDFDEAAMAYRQASEQGQAPEPGFTLLQFVQGKHDLAAAAIRRLMNERQSHVARADILLAAVEVLTSVGDTETARAAVEELARMREQRPGPLLRPLAAHAEGALCLAEENVAGAFTHLREAWMLWQELEVPYHAARVRVLLGQACQRAGDGVAAEFEFQGARRFFERVSAQPDVARVDQLLQAANRRGAPPLSAREVQVIELLATGRTNREIAQALSISERTVDRHVSNILLKLNLPTRSAVTAYAYEHDLVARIG